MRTLRPSLRVRPGLRPVPLDETGDATSAAPASWPGSYGGFFVNRAAALFFAPRGGECCDWLEARSRPSICWAARDVGERSLVKAEAAGGGGRRPAFTRVRSPTTIAW